MDKTDFRELTRKPRFEPFRILVSDGTTHDILHPDMVMATDTHVVVPIAWEGHPGKERTRLISLEHVLDVVVPIEIPAKGSNGKADGGS